jgi:hypothetical protein
VAIAWRFDERFDANGRCSLRRFDEPISNAHNDDPNHRSRHRPYLPCTMLN